MITVQRLEQLREAVELSRNFNEQEKDDALAIINSIGETLDNEYYLEGSVLLEISSGHTPGRFDLKNLNTYLIRLCFKINALSQKISFDFDNDYYVNGERFLCEVFVA